MQVLKNNKAIRNTAIFPMAKLTNQTRLVKSNVTQKTELEKFSIEEASRISGVSADDFIAFYKLKGYIRKEAYGYSATALGIEKGCVVNDKNHNALITMDGICKIASVWAAVEEGKQLIERYGLCVNN